jgi:excinuclease ABC subunit A
LRDVPAPAPTPQPCEFLRLEHATRHNLKDLTVDIPLGRLVCLTGVSGSGKTTLVREVLLPLLAARLETQMGAAKASERSDAEAVDSDDDQELSSEAEAPEARISGWESLGRVVLVDQAILGKTPRSNPAVYIGAFEEIREFFAQTEPARQRGLNASAFSFNSPQGQCERCRGAGYEKIEMQFLSDVFIRCPDCNGRRYRQHILEVKVKGALSRPWSIADLWRPPSRRAGSSSPPSPNPARRGERSKACAGSRKSAWATSSWASPSIRCRAVRASG